MLNESTRWNISWRIRRNISRRLQKRRRRTFIITIGHRDRSSPPGELTVNSVMAILFTDAIFHDFGAVTESVANLLTIETGDVGARMGYMTRLMTFTICGNLPIMFYASQTTTKT